jgi:lambda repressor-like predicted transcriptional regulator
LLLIGIQRTCLAALKKRGHPHAGLSAAQGYHATAAGKALKRPWPALEALIAEAAGVPPQPVFRRSRHDPVVMQPIRAAGRQET